MNITGGLTITGGGASLRDVSTEATGFYVNYLVVAGGGGGGGQYGNSGVGGGGGGGGLLSGSTLVIQGFGYTITVGSGGAAGINSPTFPPLATGTRGSFSNIALNGASIAGTTGGGGLR